jgi:hypothetical protein
MLTVAVALAGCCCRRECRCRTHLGVGLAHPRPATLTFTEVVVLTPVYPPTATAVLPTSVPAGNERCSFSIGALVHMLVAG